MDSITAARIFHDWAFKNSLLDELSVAPSSSDEEFDSIENTSEKGISILRQRRVRLIGFDDSQHRIVVFTKRAAPTTKKQKAALPTSVSDVEIEYRQGLTQGVGGDIPISFGTPAYSIRVSAGTDRYTCGSSISVGNIREAGTLTCLVRDGAGKLFGLSNNHVCGSCSHADVGLPIVAPGIADVTAGGLNPRTIGLHQRALPFLTGSPGNVNHKANSDAAIFSILDGAAVSSFQRTHFDTPATTGALTHGMNVEKVGRSTDHTEGTVTSQIYGPLQIRYQSALHNFSGNVFLEPLFAITGKSTVFSESGDSGSLIIGLDSAGNRVAVGMVIGGMNDQKAPGGVITIAIPIAPVLLALGVTLVAGHNI